LGIDVERDIADFGFYVDFNGVVIDFGIVK
jgi:hypothetical protein